MKEYLKKIIPEGFLNKLQKEFLTKVSDDSHKTVRIVFVAIARGMLGEFVKKIWGNSHCQAKLLNKYCFLLN